MTESLGLTSEVFTHDNLFSGDYPKVSKSITLLSGENLSRGALIGKVTKAAGTPVAGSNTGNGTLTGYTLGKYAKIGDYNVECVEKITDSGRFKVIDPNGERLDDATVGVAYTSDYINFTLNDGSTDFEVGDKFTVPVDVGSEKYIESVLAAVDGSSETKNMMILAKDTDASAGDVVTAGYETGQFNDNKVSFGTGWTADALRDDLKQRGIFLETPVTA